MKLRVLIPFSAILILSCKTNLKKNEHLVLPGHGFDKLILGETTKDDLINIYGENYSIDTFYFQRPFKKEIFSIGVNYKERGIMVAFNQNHKHINGILIKSPFNAVTKEGIKLNVSTFNDVERKYGKTKWILIGHDLTSPEYIGKSYDGITFRKKYNGRLTEEALLNKYLNSKVEEIEIHKFRRE